MQKLKFPNGFLWGAASAAHQIEGNNTNSDWWAWENSIKRHNKLVSEGKDPKKFVSDLACDSYNRYEEDFALAKELSHNAHRLSIEWARVEPREGEFSEKELDHYEKVLQAAKFNGLSTFVTLHHFTSPLWFAKKGGFLKSSNIGLFARFADVVSKRLGQYVDFWLTINEPEMYSSHAFMFGVWPPNHKSILSTYKVIKHLILAHNTVAPIIRFNSQKPVSMAFHLSDIQPHGFLGDLVSGFSHHLANEFVLGRVIENCDFVGVNYYNHHHVGIFGKRKHSESEHDVSDLGWGIHPEGLERVLLNLKKYQKPIYITENGVADREDKKRERFIKQHLYFAHKAIQQGVDLRGYLYWALTDNFEWHMGFDPRFGLVEIDYENLRRRKIRYSALKYAEVCRGNELQVG